VANTAPVLIWMSGTDKLCTFFSQDWLNLTGRSLKQELGKGWVAAVHPDDGDRCLEIYSSAFDARIDFQMEYRLPALTEFTAGSWILAFRSLNPTVLSGATSVRASI
jgi:PAS domain-containing protein